MINRLFLTLLGIKNSNKRKSDTKAQDANNGKRDGYRDYLMLFKPQENTNLFADLDEICQFWKLEANIRQVFIHSDNAYSFRIHCPYECFAQLKLVAGFHNGVIECKGDVLKPS
jgi:hypothetical protein